MIINVIIRFPVCLQKLAYYRGTGKNILQHYVLNDPRVDLWYLNVDEVGLNLKLIISITTEGIFC